MKERPMKLPGNMQSMMKQAQQMQQRMQEEIAQIRAEGSAGGGMVTVIAKAKGELVSIRIEPEIVNDNDIEMLQDLITAAVNDALGRGQDLMKEEVAKLAGGLGIPPGLI